MEITHFLPFLWFISHNFGGIAWILCIDRYEIKTCSKIFDLPERLCQSVFFTTFGVWFSSAPFWSFWDLHLHLLSPSFSTLPTRCRVSPTRYISPRIEVLLCAALLVTGGRWYITSQAWWHKNFYAPLSLSYLRSLTATTVGSWSCTQSRLGCVWIRSWIARPKHLHVHLPYDVGDIHRIYYTDIKPVHSPHRYRYENLP